MTFKADIDGSMRSGVLEQYQATCLSEECRARMANIHLALQDCRWRPHQLLYGFLPALSRTLRTTSNDMSPQRCLVTSTTKENPGITTCPYWRTYQPFIATGIARLTRAGLDSCISLRLLINNRICFATTPCKSISKYRASHRRDRRTLPMTQPRILCHSMQFTFQRSHHLLQARHRNTSLCGCLHSD